MRIIKQTGLLIGILALGVTEPVRTAGLEEGTDGFAVVAVNFEQNATDGDTEVVFAVKGGDDGIEWLSVTGPGEQTVLRFECPGPVTLGMRQFRFESPEPTDVGSLKKAFPEGDYTFRGRTVEGGDLVGVARLSHSLPPVTTIVYPGDEVVDPRKEDLRIKWKSVAGATGYILEIEQEDTQARLTVRLPASPSSFAAPEGFLASGLEYQLGVGAVTRDGNVSFVEMTFETAE